MTHRSSCLLHVISHTSLNLWLSSTFKVFSLWFLDLTIFSYLTIYSEVVYASFGCRKAVKLVVGRQSNSNSDIICRLWMGGPHFTYRIFFNAFDACVWRTLRPVTRRGG